jgi:hypothetical protein
VFQSNGYGVTEDTVRACEGSSEGEKDLAWRLNIVTIVLLGY